MLATVTRCSPQRVPVPEQGATPLQGEVTSRGAFPVIVARPSLTPSRTTSHTSRGTDSSPPRPRQVFEAAASTAGTVARAASSAALRTPTIFTEAKSANRRS